MSAIDWGTSGFRAYRLGSQGKILDSRAAAKGILAAARAGSRRERRAWIVPGLSCRDAAGVHDVMRGEEVQVLGAQQNGLICLPGTHSKWVVVDDEKIIRFSTYMTGEMYAVLKPHSILGRMMEEGIEGGKADPRAFSEGVKRSGEPGGLLHHLFGVLGIEAQALDPEAAARGLFRLGVMLPG